MRPRSWIALRRQVAGGVFAVAACIALVASPAQAEDNAAKSGATLTALVGDVSVVKGKAPAKKLTVDSPLVVGDIVKTGASARAQLKFVDGSVVTLGENSEIKIGRYRVEGDDRHGFLDLVRGVARAVVTKMAPASTFEIRTPTAVAAVRSTTWMLEYNAKGETEVFVGEGSVAVTSRGAGLGRVLLEPGHGTTVAKDKAPIPPEVWAQARAGDMRQRASMP
ncbi:MAG TPA: FecR domain-containing protein [Alphaproteobacteria bacterium]